MMMMSLWNVAPFMEDVGLLLEDVELGKMTWHLYVDDNSLS
jgi:hypothetical protein